MSEKNHRPWGFYEVLCDQPDHKVKRITVFSGKRLSYQKHRKRAEHWFILQGNGEVVLDDTIVPVYPGMSVDIEKDVAHRVSNTGIDDIIIVEIQTGDYFGEDDIERLHDDYGRA